MAVAEAGGGGEWVWEDVGEEVEMEVVVETRKRRRRGEAVEETVEVWIPYDVVALIVEQLDKSELAWVRGVCRGMREAADRRWRVLRAGKNVPRGMQNQCVPWKGWRGAVQSVKRMQEVVPVTSRHWKRVACNRIARYGCLAVLKWARENGCNWDSATCARAAGDGHLAVLKWARENGCIWDSDTCAWAAWNGHLAVLQWARANGCEWDWCTCACAAENGHLAVLKWTRENGCNWSSGTCACAAQNGHTHVLEWAHDRPVEEWPCAGEGGCGWAREQGLAWGA